MTETATYIHDAIKILDGVDQNKIESMIQFLIELRERKGRLFFLGVGGSAANCSHAVNDFRKILDIEAYSPVDNVAEMTARTNDEGWHTVFSTWLEGSRLCDKDAVFVFSVGGGNAERNISSNIVEALKVARNRGAKILGIVGRDGGYTAQVADICLIIPTINVEKITPHVESFQSLISHLIASDSRLMTMKNKWESIRLHQGEH